MQFGREIKKRLLARGMSEVGIIELLVSVAEDVKVVWDTSTYSFIFELTLPQSLKLLDPFGLPLAADTHAVYAADAPELGTPVTKVCAKISFVYDAANLLKDYHGEMKETTTTVNAYKEADTQRWFFENLSCQGTEASFVPDVIAHAILTRVQFKRIFGPSLSSSATSKSPHIFGTPNGIYNWIEEWITSNGIMVDVILMEMMDFERTAPGVPRTKPFQMIYSLRGKPEYIPAALRMVAEIAVVRGKGIMPHDFHDGNGMTTPDGMQLYLIDWGGLFNLSIQADIDKVLEHFENMCAKSKTTEQEEMRSAAAVTKAIKAKTHEEIRLARFPCLEDLCRFFQITFVASDRDETIGNLRAKFVADLGARRDFTCNAPDELTVHHALMMVAFVDFLANRMNSNYPNCQCGNVMSVVYPDQVGTYASSTGIDVSEFNDFRTFLKKFKVNSLPLPPPPHPPHPPRPPSNLPVVVKFITEIAGRCSSACLQVSELRPSWMHKEAERMRAEAMRLAEEERMRVEAEAMRLAEEERMRVEAAEAMRLAEEARRVKENKAEAASKKRLEFLSKKSSEKSSGVSGERSGVGKQSTSSTPQKALQAAQAVQMQAAEAEAGVAVPGRWYNPKSWLAWLSRKKGGTRKQCKHRRQRKCFTKRKHN